MASGFAAVNFTTKPKDADYFVASDATLRWEYSSRKAIQYVKFGIQIGDDDVAIVVKDVDAKEVQFNSFDRPQVTESFIGRVDVVKNEQASFRIKNLTLNDTGKYFLNLDRQNGSKIPPQYVQVTVVGEYFTVLLQFHGSTFLNRREFFIPCVRMKYENE